MLRERHWNPLSPVLRTSLTVCFSTLRIQPYLLTGCRWLQPNVRHKYRWSRPAWRPSPGSFAASLFHSGVWTCWRNERSLSLRRVLSASLWRVKDAVPVTAAAAQEAKSPWILPRAGRQKGKPQTQQIPGDREPGCSLLSQAEPGAPYVLICIN